MKVKFPLALRIGIGLCIATTILFQIVTFVKPDNFRHLQEVFSIGLLAGLFMVAFSVTTKE